MHFKMEQILQSFSYVFFMQLCCFPDGFLIQLNYKVFSTIENEQLRINFSN